MRSAPAEATKRGRATAPLLTSMLLVLLLPALLLAAAAGPDSGASGARAAELCEISPDLTSMDVSCALPSGLLALDVSLDATSLEIICEENGTFACEELRELRPLIDEYMDDERNAANGVVENFKINNCHLPSEQLRCPLLLVGADDSVQLELIDVRGALLPLHVEGMLTVEEVKIFGKDGDNSVTTMPYEVLSKLPALRDFQLDAAALVLEPDAEHLPILEQLKRLSLSNMGLRSLPRGAFQNTPNLEYLRLAANDIEYVDEDAFLGLSHLADMSLVSNRIPPLTLRPCTRLASLWLSSNRMEVLPTPLLQGLHDLTEVTIEYNEGTLRMENGVFANLRSLYQVTLISSSIMTLPEDLFHNSTALQLLDLTGNLIQSLPARIFRGLKLRKLVLRNNTLAHLPADVFSGLHTLQSLDLSYNALVTLNESVFAPLSRLHDLDLSHNRLQRLDIATFRIRSLERLSLANNNLTVACSRGSSDHFHYSMPHLRLRALDLSHNRVTRMCDEWRFCNTLGTLDLSHNNFTSLSSKDTTFFNKAMVNVEYNRIRHVHFDYGHVHIDKNRIHLNDGHDSDFDFRNDYFKIGHDLVTKATLFLNHNPFVCDCELYEFVDKRAAHALPVHDNINEAVCAEPAALKNTALAELSGDELICARADCPTGCSCLLRPSRSRLEIACQTVPFVLSSTIETLPAHLRLLRASDLLRLPSDVTFVDLSGLNLTEAPRVNRSLEIDLSRNRLRDFPIELLERNCTVHLAHNPFDCDCRKRDELEFVKMHHHLVMNYTSIICDNGILVAGIEIDQLCAERVYTVVGCALTLLGVVVAVATAAAYRYQTEVRILLRMLGLWRDRGVVDDKLYDAFLSFAHQDQRYVEETLVPALEGGRRPLRLLLHHRDWVVGDFIPTQIASSVDDSRRTIIVLSRHFLQSVWAQMEFQAAHGSDKLIILMLDDADELRALCALDADLRAYLALNTYVRADDPLVFERLKDAVLRRRRAFARTRERTNEQTRV